MKTRIYIVDENHIDEDDCASMYTDEQFKDVAESQGFVYSLEGFQHQWNEDKLNIDQDCHWIRFL